MKNSNRKTKLIARVMLLVFLLASAVSFVGCGEANLLGYYDQQCREEYYSHEEFQNFIEKYNSRNDGFVGSFISFDFDSSNIVEDKCYEWFMVARLNKYMDDMMFDKYQEDRLGLNFVLYVNDFYEINII